MEDYYKTLPKKRMAAGALFFNSKNQLLLVKPIYKDHWTIPGGVIDADESPREGCIREIIEELGNDFGVERMLIIDYIHDEGKGENIQFVFYGGVLSDEQISKIKLQKEELSEYKFFEIDEAVELRGKNFARRAPHCMQALKENKILYLENGNPVK